MSKPRPQPTLDQASQARLGEKLRSMYDQLPDEPLPHELQVLVGALARIDALQRAPATERPRLDREHLSRTPQRPMPRIPAGNPLPLQAASGRR